MIVVCYVNLIFHNFHLFDVSHPSRYILEIISSTKTLFCTQVSFCPQIVRFLKTMSVSYDAFFSLRVQHIPCFIVLVSIYHWMNGWIDG